MNEQYDFTTEKKVKETRSIWHEVFDWIESIGITFLCVFFALTFCFRVVTIEGDSMMNTLIEGEKVVISNLFYEAKQGDIVVISRNYKNDPDMVPNESNSPIIKRVIATEGQWIDIDFEEGIVYVGNSVETMQPYKEDYIRNLTTVPGDFEGPQQIEKGHVFVLGDNRSVSLDSRYDEIGQVDTNYILGKAYFRLTPFEKFGTIYN